MTMRIPEETITQITERLDIVGVIGEYVALSKKGNRFWGLCPFHGEKTPSFAVTPEKGVYYCFGCHKGGSVLTFIMEIEKVPFIEAVEFAAKKAGIAIALRDDQPGTLKKDAFLDLYKRVALSFQHFLLHHEKGKAARQYLSNRKIGEDIQKQFYLGYAPPEREWLYDFLKAKNYSDEFLNQSGLFSRAKQAYFTHRIIFPIINARDEVVAFGGRALEDFGPKYLNSPETIFFHKGSNLYGINLAIPAMRENGFFYLVEGYIDVIAMNASGISNCVAPLGTALTEQQVKLLKRYGGKAVLVFDSDTAGFKATLRAIEMLENADLESEVVELEGRKDPAEIFEKDGKEALHKALKYTINSFHYIIKKATTQHDITTPRGKEGVVLFIAPFLSRVHSRIRQDAYIEMVADALGSGEDSIRKDLGRIKNEPRIKTSEIKEKTAITIIDNYELFLMLTAAIVDKGFVEVRNKIHLEDLQDPPAKELYIALEECFRNDEHTIEQLINRIDSEEIKTILIEKASSEGFTVNHEEMIANSIVRIQKRNLEQKKVEISNKIREYEKQKPEPYSIKDLQLEIMCLDEELKKLKAREYGRDN